MNDLPIQAIIKEVEVSVQQIIINNQVQEVKAKVLSLCCSSCGRVINSFNQGEHYIDVYKALMENKEELNKHFGYCAECGSKLRFDFDVFDAEVVNE